MKNIPVIDLVIHHVTNVLDNKFICYNKYNKTCEAIIYIRKFRNYMYRQIQKHFNLFLYCQKSSTSISAVHIGLDKEIFLDPSMRFFNIFYTLHDFYWKLHGRNLFYFVYIYFVILNSYIATRISWKWKDLKIGRWFSHDLPIKAVLLDGKSWENLRRVYVKDSINDISQEKLSRIF